MLLQIIISLGVDDKKAYDNLMQSFGGTDGSIPNNHHISYETFNTIQVGFTSLLLKPFKFLDVLDCRAVSRENCSSLLLFCSNHFAVASKKRGLRKN